MSDARDGATILVKLHQFAPEDLTAVQLDTSAVVWNMEDDGVKALLLHSEAREIV